MLPSSAPQINVIARNFVLVVVVLILGYLAFRARSAGEMPSRLHGSSDHHQFALDLLFYGCREARLTHQLLDPAD